MESLTTFNNLPREVQVEILKESPTFIRLNKDFLSEKRLFSTTYCDLDISKQEVLSYIAMSPDVIIMYGMNNKFFEITILYKKVNSANYDMSKYLFGVLESKIEVADLVNNNVNIADKIKKMYEKYETVFFDANTVYDIISLRTNCNNNNIPLNYTKKYINNIMNLTIEGNEKYYLYNKAIISSYMESTYRTLQGKIIKFLNADMVDNIYFDLDMPVDQKLYDNLVSELEDDITTNYNEIMDVLK